MGLSVEPNQPSFENSNPTEQKIVGEKIGIREKIGYGMGGAANNVMWTGIASFLMYFYTDVLGVSAALIGTIMFFSRFIDGFDDIAMGILVDRTNSRHGKARPWLLWMAIPFAIAAVLL